MSDRYGQEDFRASWVEEECRGKSFSNFGPEVVGKVVVSYVAVLVLGSCGMYYLFAQILLLRPPVPKCNQISQNFRIFTLSRGLPHKNPS